MFSFGHVRFKLSLTQRPLVVNRRNMSSSTRGNPAQYCLELVKRTDHEHFLTNLLLPDTIRTDSFAIRALNTEVSGVRDNVSDRTIGLVRMQFWKDTIDNLYENKVPQHPVAVQLHKVINQNKPSKELLLRMIQSREQFLSDKPFDTLEQVELYGEQAFSSVYLLLLELLGNDSGHAKHAATQLGKCEGLVTILRATPYNAAKRRCYLPSDLLLEQEVSSEKVIRGGGEEQAVRDVVEVIAGRAQQHLDSCRFRMKYMEKDHKLVLLPAVAVDAYLDRLSKAQCNLWDKSLHSRNSWLPMSLYWHKFKQTY
eukprot:GFUD01007797.1.p2 GENE.GFUD01007797.1~~GFUD01007797.1.p2  ORF type:complete len:311 (+),score=90.06 GFUD01007797.1:1561-2493(+)